MHYVLTPAAGKRLIGKALAHKIVHDPVLKNGVVIILAGTTNGYLAEELLQELNQANGFSRQRFFRGITTSTKVKTLESGRLAGDPKFPGDVVIARGVWQKGKTIFDVLNDLQEGDMIIKGANCVDLHQKKAGILIGHPQGGTIVAALQAIVGRRVRLLIPVGLEKRIVDNIDTLAQVLNTPGGNGPRMLPIQGDIFTELDALKYLFDVQAQLIAAGGVCGAEGSIRVYLKKDINDLQEVKKTLDALSQEEPFTLG